VTNSTAFRENASIAVIAPEPSSCELCTSTIVAFESTRDGNNEIYVAAPDGTNQRRLTTNPALDESPAVSPDGRRIAFASDRNGNSSYGYYDYKGRQTAAVDAAGFLVQTDYDDQDHVVEQRKYTVSLGTFDPSVTPSAPSGGSVYKVDSVYDAVRSSPLVMRRFTEVIRALYSLCPRLTVGRLLLEFGLSVGTSRPMRRSVDPSPMS